MNDMVTAVDFRKVSGEKLHNVEEYVKAYLKDYPEVEIMVGTDSQNSSRKTVYSTVIALYNPGHGAHCIFKRWVTPKERNRQTRLLNEVQASIEVADSLVAAGIKKPTYIDIDINPNPRYKSNEVFAAAKGWVEGSGYEVRFKTFGPLVTTFADWIVKR
jgi:predicted RNase H-related nuclease YkuK (DUF458 family)